MELFPATNGHAKLRSYEFDIKLESSPVQSLGPTELQYESSARRSLRARHPHQLAAVALLIAGFGTSFVHSEASAADPTAPNQAQPGENAAALPGLIRIALPTSETALVVAGATADYGLFNRVGSMSSGGHRLGGTLAASVTPIEAISLRGQLSGRINLHSGEDYGADDSAYGEPELAALLRYPLNDQVALGFEIEARVIGGEVPSVDFSALTPTFSGLLAYQLASQSLLALNVGYRIDNSAKPLDLPTAEYRDGDRLLLGVSSFDAIEVGVGASHRMGATELLAEITGDVLLGTNAPSFLKGPLSIGAGVRHHFGKAVQLRAGLEFSPAAIPDPFPDDAFLPLRPRFGLFLGGQWRFDFTESPDSQAPQKTVPPKPKKRAPKREDAAPQGVISGKIVDEAGQPIPDVQVSIRTEQGKPKQTYTDADGRFIFDHLEYGTYQVTSETPGFDNASYEVVLKNRTAKPIDMTVYESVPAGQVKGRVLTLRGEVIPAEVTFTPGNKSIQVDASGEFSVDLSPGTYTVRFKHPNFRNQVRTIRVQDKGVVVLNIALEN